MTGKEPEYKRLRIFGAKGYAHVPNEKRRTFDSTGIPIRMLGYSMTSNEYIVQSLTTVRHIFQARTLKLDEKAVMTNTTTIDPDVSLDILQDDMEKKKVVPVYKLRRRTVYAALSQIMQHFTTKSNGHIALLTHQKTRKGLPHTSKYY